MACLALKGRIWIAPGSFERGDSRLCIFTIEILEKIRCAHAIGAVPFFENRYERVDCLVNVFGRYLRQGVGSENTIHIVCAASIRLEDGNGGASVE